MFRECPTPPFVQTRQTSEGGMDMEKKAFRWIAVLLFLAVAAGCAEKKAYAPVDVMPNVRAAGQVQCIDNFVVLFDRSDSMNAFYQPVV